MLGTVECTWLAVLPSRPATGKSGAHLCLLLQDKRDKQDKLADSNLYIKNIDDGQTDDTLRQLFEVRGPCWMTVGTGTQAQAPHSVPARFTHKSLSVQQAALLGGSDLPSLALPRPHI